MQHSLPASDIESILADAHALRRWLDRHERVFVLTGAGVSTASGIPDYRNTDGTWKRDPPVTYQALVGDPATYRRYWARSFVGWPSFSNAQPNASHRALAAFEQTDRITALVTQNVNAMMTNYWLTWWTSDRFGHETNWYVYVVICCSVCVIAMCA